MTGQNQITLLFSTLVSSKKFHLISQLKSIVNVIYSIIVISEFHTEIFIAMIYVKQQSIICILYCDMATRKFNGFESSPRD